MGSRVLDRFRFEKEVLRLESGLGISLMDDWESMWEFFKNKHEYGFKCLIDDAIKSARPVTFEGLKTSYERLKQEFIENKKKVSGKQFCTKCSGHGCLLATAKIDGSSHAFRCDCRAEIEWRFPLWTSSLREFYLVDF